MKLRRRCPTTPVGLARYSRGVDSLTLLKPPLSRSATRGDSVRSEALRRFRSSALASALITAARIAATTHHAKDAVWSLTEAVEVLRRHGPMSRPMEALGELAQLHAAGGDLKVANALYAEALAIRRP